MGPGRARAWVGCGALAAALASAGCTAIYGDARSSDGAAGDLRGADFSGADLAGGGLLTGQGQNANGAVDLTALGSSDWAHWGTSLVTDFDHKASGNNQIGAFTVVGGATARQTFTTLLSYSWSDGTPHGTSGGSMTGVQGSTTNGGFHFTAAASPTERTLTVWVGGAHSAGQLTAHLSDGSAPDYVDATFSNANSSYAVKYTITYRAASANQTIGVDWIELANLGGSGVNTGNVSLQSAALK